VPPSSFEPPPSAHISNPPSHLPDTAVPLLPEHHTDLKHALSCAAAPVVPLPRFFCGSFAECYDLVDTADADGRHAVDLDLEVLRACEDADAAPWCLAGMRIACDGSLVGVCARCDVEMLWAPSAG
jgi:hypothetical protein